MTARPVFAGVLGFLLVVGGGLAGLFPLGLDPGSEESPGGGETATPGEIEGRAPPEVQGVETSRVVRDTLRIPVLATGRAEALRRIEVVARLSGLVRELPIREEQWVPTGTLLLRLDSTELSLQRREAAALRTAAEAQFQERMLYAGDFLGEADLRERARIVRATSGLESAELRLRKSELELEWAAVRAPFNGWVADLVAVEGAFVSAGTPLLTLVQTDTLRVEVRVLEGDLPRISRGKGATVTFPALADRPFRAEVSTVNPLVDPSTSSARVTLILPNPEGRVWPGMYARVRVEAEVYPDLLLIPRVAVVERGEDRQSVVFVLREPDGEGRGRAEWRYVTLGRFNETWVEVLEDPRNPPLLPGEQVLVEGHLYLAHGTWVQDRGAGG